MVLSVKGIATIVGVVLLLTGTAIAAQPAMYKPPALGQRSDGESRFVWQHGSSIYVRDDGRPWSRPRVLTAPAGCGDIYEGWGVVGSGYALFVCPPKSRGDAGRLRILNLRTGQLSDPAHYDELVAYKQRLGAISYPPIAIGRSLIEFDANFDRGDSDFEWNWHTGQVFQHLDPNVPNGRQGRVHAFDLDYPTGLRRLCSPLRLGVFRAYDEFRDDYVARSDLLRFESPFLVRNNPRGIFVQRCGSRKARRLTRHAQSEPLVTASYVAWTSSRTLSVYRFRTGKIERWALPLAGRHILDGTRGTLIIELSSHRNRDCPCTLRAIDFTKRA